MKTKISIKIKRNAIVDSNVESEWQRYVEKKIYKIISYRYYPFIPEVKATTNEIFIIFDDSKRNNKDFNGIAGMEFNFFSAIVDDISTDEYEISYMISEIKFEIVGE